MPSTKLTSVTRRTWTKEILDYVDLNGEFVKVQKGIQAHRHTETNTDTDSLDTGNALQIDGTDEIKNGTIKLTLTLGSISDGEVAGGLNGKFQVFTSSATPDAENTIAHELGRVPVGFIVVNKDKAAIVYKGSTAWDSTNIYLKVNVASTIVTILVF